MYCQCTLSSVAIAVPGIFLVDFCFTGLLWESGHWVRIKQQTKYSFFLALQ